MMMQVTSNPNHRNDFGAGNHPATKSYGKEAEGSAKVSSRGDVEDTSLGDSIGDPAANSRPRDTIAHDRAVCRAYECVRQGRSSQR